jgi:hypothetical protein
MTSRERAARAYRGWVNETLSRPDEIASPEALEAFIASEIEAAVAEQRDKDATVARLICAATSCRTVRKTAQAIRDRIMGNE